MCCERTFAPKSAPSHLVVDVSFSRQTIVFRVSTLYIALVRRVFLQACPSAIINDVSCDTAPICLR